MKLGLDFDGTIADTTFTKILYAEEMFGVTLTPIETFGAAGRARIGEERFEQLVAFAHREWTVRTPPMPGAIEAIEQLTQQHELYLVTARTDEERDHAEAWLEAHGITMTGVLHTSHGSKLEACQRLGIDLVLDDLPRMLHDLVEAGIAGALIEADYNREAERHAAIHAVPDWPAFVAHCAVVERARMQRGATAR